MITQRKLTRILQKFEAEVASSLEFKEIMDRLDATGQNHDEVLGEAYEYMDKYCQRYLADYIKKEEQKYASKATDITDDIIID